jgi:hypothetical protein
MSKKRNVPTTVSLKDAKFVYISACCNEVAEKPACAMPKGKGVGLYAGAKPEGESTLGSWRCSKCKKPVKVTRQEKKSQEASARVYLYTKSLKSSSLLPLALSLDCG